MIDRRITVFSGDHRITANSEQEYANKLIGVALKSVFATAVAEVDSPLICKRCGVSFHGDKLSKD